MNKLEQKLTDLLINYVSGSILNFEQLENELNIPENRLKNDFYNFSKEWDALPCDSEGFTNEQNQAADDLINKYIKDFINLKNEIRHQKTLINIHAANMRKIAHDIEKLRNRKNFDFGAIDFECEQYQNEYKLYNDCILKIKELEA